MDWGMSDFRTGKVNRVVSAYDHRLFAIRSSDGVIHVLRQGSKPGDSDYTVESPVKRPYPQFIFALTDTWNLGGRPVEWGIEPIYHRLIEMDAQSRYSRPDDRMDDMKKQRDAVDRDRERQKINNGRDFAKELRPHFAKATNDIVMPAGNKNVSQVFVK
jgi:hypothetical protein